MSRQFWSETLAWATASGTAVANSTAETILFPNVTIPANYLQDGRTLRLRVQGQLSTTGTPTITFFVRWGGVSGTLIAKSSAITTGSGASAAVWDMEVMIQTRSNGSSGTVMSMGQVSVNGAATLANLMSAGGGSTPATASLDLTADTALAISAQWSAASASNTITGLNYIIEGLN